MILDTKDSWAAALVKEGIVDRFMEADLSQHDRVWNICVGAISQVEQACPALLQCGPVSCCLECL